MLDLCLPWFYHLSAIDPSTYLEALQGYQHVWETAQLILIMLSGRFWQGPKVLKRHQYLAKVINAIFLKL